MREQSVEYQEINQASLGVKFAIAEASGMTKASTQSKHLLSLDLDCFSSNKVKVSRQLKPNYKTFLCSFSVEKFNSKLKAQPCDETIGSQLVDSILSFTGEIGSIVKNHRK